MPDDQDLYARLSRELVSELYKDRDVFNLSAAFVEGVEVTQGIQWYRASQHLTDSADRGPDNGITLIGNKPAWVRVYIGGFFKHDGVTAKVTLQRRNALLQYVDSSTPISQGYGVVDYDPATSYKDTRGSLYNSLNFVIPASEMRGNFRLAVTITTGSGQTATASYDFDATLVQTLAVRGIPIRYWGADSSGNQVQLGPTTAADLANTATWSLLTYPVEAVPSISLAGIFTWSESLAGAADVPGGCSTGWYDLLYWLSLAKALDGNKPNVIYYGLLPAGTPDGPVIGCDSSGASAGKVGDGITMAHEMGHYQGFPHSPCGNVGTPDASYPAYEPYDTASARTASIGEFGLDISTGTIYDPAVAKDYMSYCGPQWTSLYHYRGQMLSPWFNPRYVSDGDSRSAWWDHYKLYRPYDVKRDLPYPNPVEQYLVHDTQEAPLERSIVLTGVITDGELDVRSVLRLDAVARGGELGVERLELLDAEGVVIGRAALRHQPMLGCAPGGHRGATGGGGCGGCGGDSRGASPSCPRVVEAVVPHSDRVVSMRVVRGPKVIWTLDAPKEPPIVDHLRAELGDEGLSVAWRASEQGIAETHLRMSSDRGETWSLLELGVRGSETMIPVDVLPPGTHLVQALVSDGFHTVVSEPVEIDVPHRAPSATIHWPLDGAAVASSATMRLWGSGLSAGTAALPDDAHAWSIDGRPVGTGRDIWVAPPEADGEHLVTLTVRDGHGETSAWNRFWVSCSGLAPRRLSE
jgi:hypothetical protein